MNPSPELDRLRAARPALVARVRFVPQQHRGRTWYLLADALSGSQLLLDRPAFGFVSALDGTQRIADLVERTGVDEDDAIALLATLHDADLLSGDLAPSAATLLARHRERGRRERLGRLGRPLSLRVPLLDPTALLRSLAPLGAFAFSRAGLVLWLAIVAAGGWVTVREAGALAAHFEARFVDPTNFLLLWLLYPVVKGLHELGHGLAAQRWGAAVHEMGVMLLVFVPVPYVDASATSAFPAARPRMVVAGAGILVELMLAALATLAWSAVDPGLLRDALFDVIVLGGASTLLFNGNPLLRFDGYYVLVDAIGMPNLGSRARAYLGHLLRGPLLGLPSTTAEDDPRERAWLIAYGIASSAYRLFIGLAIAAFVAGRFFVLGVLLAALHLYQQLLAPLLRALADTGRLARQEQALPRVVGTGAIVVVGLVALLVVVPLPRSTVAEAIVTAPEGALLRAGTSGFVTAVEADTGTLIAAGAVILRLADDDRVRREALLAAETDELRAHLGVATTEDRRAAADLRERLATAEARLADVRDRLTALDVVSPRSGELSWIRRLPPGTFVRRGQPLAYVTDGRAWRLTALVDQRDLERVRDDARTVRVVSRSAPSVAETARIASRQPIPVATLPDRRLGTLGGGSLPVDARDPLGVRLLTPMFAVEVALPAESEARYRFGERCIVRFVHAPAPLGRRLLSAATRRVQDALDR